MAAITINDLHRNLPLEPTAMSSIRGAGAGWIYGWIRPYIDARTNAGFNSTINLYQTNNFYFANQMNNQISVIDVHSSATNSTINVNATQQALNFIQA